MAAMIRTVWFLWMDRHIDQWNIIENPEIDPHKYAQLIFYKGAEGIQWRRIDFSTNDAGAVGQL